MSLVLLSASVGKGLERGAWCICISQGLGHGGKQNNITSYLRYTTSSQVC